MSGSQHIPSEAIYKIVSRALNSERGISIPFKSPGEAIYWRQRYYKCRATILKQDPTSDWRTLSAFIPHDNKCVVHLVPTDSQINMEEITDL